MTAEALGQSADQRGGRTLWQRHLGLLGFAFICLAILAGDDALGIMAVWSRTGAFHHCFLIPPIIGWLIWQKRDALRAVQPEFSLAGCGIVGAGSLLWLVGAAGFIDLFRQAAFVICAVGLVVALLGRPIAKLLVFPLGYAIFLVPVGSEFEPTFQLITARISVVLLHAAGVPATLEGVFIATPIGLFRVAEACSGTGFLLAMAAYAALVCHLCFTSPIRRTVFASIAMLLALLANGVRAWAVMFIANHSNMANPIVADHILYGWLLFAVVLLLLMWGGAGWFDHRPGDIKAVPAVRRGRWRAAILLPLLAFLLLLPRIWLMAGATPVRGESSPPVPPQVHGWTIPAGPFQPRWQPHFDGATWIGQWRYTDPTGHAVDLAIVIFGRQWAGREQGAPMGTGGWADAGPAASPSGGRGEWLRGTDGNMRYVATFYLVGDRVMGSRAIAKLAAVRTRLLGGRQDAVAILVSAEPVNGQKPAETVRHFLNAAGSVQELADRARPIR